MTVRVTTLKGLDAGAYYAEHLPSYYLQADEPPGRWLGQQTRELFLDAAPFQPEPFMSLMAGKDPLGQTVLGKAYDEKSVRGFDVTASAPKSVSVLFALGDEATRQQVVEAHDAAVAAMADWIERHAHTRRRIGGQVAVVDANGIIAAAFRQHTSRALDPQLHTHLVIINRVRSADGRWLALDARLIKHDQQSLSAIYHACLRAEMTARLGVRWREPVHGIAEIADVAENVLDEFSTRAIDVRRRLDAKLDRFVESLGREPTSRERWKLEREAAVDSRPTKPEALDAATLHDGWHEQVRRLGLQPSAVVAGATGRTVAQGGIDAGTRATMIDRTVTALSTKQTSWRPTEIHRELAAVMPTETAAPALAVARSLDEVVDQISQTRCIDLSRPVPDGARLRRDGRPYTESIVDRALSTAAILEQEERLIEWADRRVDQADESANLLRASDLDPGQVAAACSVAGRADLVLVVGPAGAGKTSALTSAVEHLRSEGRVVFGVAPSAVAAQELTEKTVVAADTVDKLLIEHRLSRPPDHRFDLPAGATVLVDEAGMIPTARLAELAELADTRGWRIALTGDPLQFSAVGRGGMFGLLLDTFGGVELERIHRFRHPWEREASLRLRRGDVSAADDYESHGRLHGGAGLEMERASVRRWWQLRGDNQRALLISPTDEAVARLNERCQQLRIDAGEIDTSQHVVRLAGSTLYSGDEVATRHNDRRLVTDRGVTVKNRATWTIKSVGRDGSVAVTGRHGSVRLPADYAAEHVELAYATTGHGAQGRTVDAAVLFLDGPTDVRNLYVPMSRGIETNEAFIAVAGEQQAVDVFAQSIAIDWIDQPAHARRAQLNDTKPHRPGLLDDDEVNEKFARRFELAKTISRASSVVDRHASAMQSALERLRTAEASIERQRHDSAAAEADLLRFDRPMQRRKHAQDIVVAKQQLHDAPALIAAAIAERADALTHVEELKAGLQRAQELLQRRAGVEARIEAIDAELARDAAVRSRIARLERPAQLVAAIGERPAAGHATVAWDRAAGQILQHQAAFGITDGLGPAGHFVKNSAYDVSRAAVGQLAAALGPPPPQHPLSIRPLGLSL